MEPSRTSKRAARQQKTRLRVFRRCIRGFIRAREFWYAFTGSRQPDTSTQISGLRIEDPPIDAAGYDEDGLRFELAQELANLKNARKFERAWRLHTTGDGSQDPAVLEILSSSPRLIDASRAEAVFDAIGYERRSAWMYRAVIVSLLAFGKGAKANQVHEEAEERHFNSPFGTDVLLADAVNKCAWRRAFDIWERSPSRKWPAAIRRITLWRATRELPRRVLRAFTMVRFASNHPYKRSPPVRALPLLKSFRDFVVQFVQVVLCNWHYQQDGKLICGILDGLSKLHLLKASHFENAIDYALNKRQLNAASSIYWKLRRNKFVERPGIELYHAMLRVYCERDQAKQIKILLDDLTKVYGCFDPVSFRIAALHFGEQGKPGDVRSLLARYTNHYGPIKQIGDLVPLLLAYARCGHLRKTRNLFDRLGPVYRLPPNLTCWNILIDGYCRIEDADGAWQCFEDLKSTDMVPDRYTYGPLIQMYGDRGDIAGVKELLQEAKGQGVEIDARLYDGLVLAYIKNKKVDEAEQLAEKAVAGQIPGSATRMWNFVLQARTTSGQYAKAIYLFHRLKDAGLPMDSHTYASAMQAYILSQDVHSARYILLEQMRRDNVRPTSLNFAVLMGYYSRHHELPQLYSTHRHMAKLGLPPALNTNLMLLHGSVTESSSVLCEKRSPGRAEALMEEVMRNADVSEASGPTARITATSQPINMSYPGAYFVYLITMFRKKRAYKKVRSLYDLYLRAVNEWEMAMPSMRMLAAVMGTFRAFKEHDRVEECWQLAYAGAMTMCKKGGSQRNALQAWVAPNRKNFLALPLSELIRSLATQHKSQQLKDLVRKLAADGYQLDPWNWNIYIQRMVRLGEFQEAFDSCERELMGDWRGWDITRGVVESHKTRRRTHRAEPLFGVVRPTYHSLVYLVRAMMDLKILESTTDQRDNIRALFQNLRDRCPLTIAAIRTMPETNDPIQTQILGTAAIQRPFEAV
ncbi:MAG: hypothetical protein M1826_001082 [Phylliscum demangeonii]|nr:MAG: hypothetical protein M1826_001082 [Phylliscum demangeonii]